MKNALARLQGWHILLIGAGVALMLFLILFFAMIRPNMIKTDETLAIVKSNEDAGGTDSRVREEQNKLKTAQKETVLINAKWSDYSRAYMPSLKFSSDPLVGYSGQINNGGVYQQLQKDGTVRNFGVKDLPAIWGKWITAWYDAQYKYGVTRKNSFPIDSFSTDPNEISKMTSITFPAAGKPWPVTLECKSFDSAMQHLKRFNQIQNHGMPVVDSVLLSGQSPNLLLTYNLSFYIIPGSAPPKEDPTISAAGVSGGGGGGGGFGGGPGGFPSGSGGPGGSSGGGSSGGAAASSGTAKGAKGAE